MFWGREPIDVFVFAFVAVIAAVLIAVGLRDYQHPCQRWQRVRGGSEECVERMP